MSDALVESTSVLVDTNGTTVYRLKASGSV
jgi:hypothetical protein